MFANILLTIRISRFYFFYGIAPNHVPFNTSKKVAEQSPNLNKAGGYVYLTDRKRIDTKQFNMAHVCYTPCNTPISVR